MAMWKLVCTNCRQEILRTNDPGNLSPHARCPYCQCMFATQKGLGIETAEEPHKTATFSETPRMKDPARAEWDEC